MAQPVVDPVLVTFPPSLDSELSRFLVQHYGIRHEEQRHALGYVFLVLLRHGFTVIFPLLYSDSFRLVGPRSIANYFDTRCASELRLFPADKTEMQQVESDWTQFNNTLAFATARFAYYHLLPHRDIMIAPLSQGAPDNEQKAVVSAYSTFAWVLTTLLGLNAKSAQTSLDQIRTVFDAVDARLASGEKFLVGDRLTLSDLAFSVAAAPVVLPPTYGGPIPSFDEMPGEIQTVVNEMKSRAAGIFALRIYQEYRSIFGVGSV
ncbi:MAG TPA: glutathione binding-like protein [Candidatus Acidoferrales bacterium]|jgi:glutathione S-transferase|nr:glutathione binding-like protein [Candidatus Acidoferrales bacterium]